MRENGSTLAPATQAAALLTPRTSGERSERTLTGAPKSWQPSCSFGPGAARLTTVITLSATYGTALGAEQWTAMQRCSAAAMAQEKRAKILRLAASSALGTGTR